jgi:uncharacterized protein (TIGR00290 family)
MARLKTLLSWSSGKDSAWALHRLRMDGRYDVAGLLTTINEVHDRVAMHAVRTDLLRRQAAAAGLTLWPVHIPSPCANEVYEAAMSSVVGRAVAAGFECIAFGDLFLEDVRSYRESKLAGTGLRPLFPLWGAETRELAEQMIDAGVRARLTCVDPRLVPRDLAGRDFDRELLALLPPGVDPCGERGEFHTFAYDGPMFTGPVPLETGEIVERDGFVFADLSPLP